MTQQTHVDEQYVIARIMLMPFILNATCGNLAFHSYMLKPAVQAFVTSVGATEIILLLQRKANVKECSFSAFEVTLLKKLLKSVF